MWHNAHNTYLESTILGADPVELVKMLYQACTQAVRDARHYLAEGQIAARSSAINRAQEILMELNLSLDHARGGEIAQRLARLYDYMQQQLLNANMQQSDAILAEVLELLTTLSEAWEEMKPAGKVEKAAAASSGWGMPVPEMAAAGSQAWSF